MKYARKLTIKDVKENNIRCFLCEGLFPSQSAVGSLIGLFDKEVPICEWHIGIYKKDKASIVEDYRENGKFLTGAALLDHMRFVEC